MFVRVEKLHQRWERYKGQKRLIEREEIILDPNKIVLSHDFFNCAVLPAIEGNSTFERLFGGKGSLIENTLNFNAQTRRIPTFPVHYKCASEQTQKIIEEELRRRVEVGLKRQVQEVERLLNAFFGETLPKEAKVVFSGPSAEVAMDRLKSSAHLPAFHLGHIMQVMDMTAGSSMLTGAYGVERYNATSLLKDEGHIALAFWKNVNALADFSGQFPSRPPPPRWGAPNDEGGKVGVNAGAWQPA